MTQPALLNAIFSRQINDAFDQFGFLFKQQSSRMRSLQQQIDDLRQWQRPIQLPTVEGVTSPIHVTITAASYTIKDTDVIVEVNRSGVVTISLPTAALVKGRQVLVVDVSGAAATNNITVDTAGSDTIDGAATYVIGLNYGAVGLESDGTNWFTTVSQVGTTAALKYPTLYATDIIGVPAGLDFIIDGGGSVITTGVAGYVNVPRKVTIKGVRLLASPSGSIVVDIWKDTFANYPPTNADTITASATPSISSGVKDEDTTLTGWTTAMAEGDILGLNVDSVTTIERCTVSLDVEFA